MESLAVLLLLLGCCACRLPGQEPEEYRARRPHAITVLGRDLVVWRDQQGDWRAFDDVCPHRLAPLSGRFCRGHCNCPLSYFELTRIPAARSGCFLC